MPAKVDTRQLMTDWFDTVSYVNDYADALPETDDPEDDDLPAVPADQNR